MNKTEAELKLAIATLESVEQHLDLIRKAIAFDAVCEDENYRHVFQGMIADLRDCRENLDRIARSVSHKCSSNIVNLKE